MSKKLVKNPYLEYHKGKKWKYSESIQKTEKENKPTVFEYILGFSMIFLFLGWVTNSVDKSK